MQVCPNCGGELGFDIASQRLKCTFCGGLFDPATFEVGAAAEEQHYTSTEPISAAEDQTMDVTPQSAMAAPGAGQQNAGAGYGQPMQGIDPNAGAGYGQPMQGYDPNVGAGCGQSMQGYDPNVAAGFGGAVGAAGMMPGQMPGAGAPAGMTGALPGSGVNTGMPGTLSGQAAEMHQDLQSPDLMAQPQAPDTQYFDVVEYTCPQCGGTLYSTENSVNGFCSYCGSNHMLSSRMAKMPAPKGVIPFQISKEQCKQAYLDKVKKSFFAPKELKDPKYLENFRGIYMPYWVYDIDYNAPVNMTGTRSYRRGNYVYTEHYKCSCDVQSFYKGISFDASSSFDDYFSQSIAPFDAKAMLLFTPTYMAGFYADLQDVNSEVYSSDAIAFVQKSIYDEVVRSGAFRGISLSANAERTVHPSINKQKDISLAFYPVWFLAYRNKDRVAYAVVNGQTGNLACDLPVDNKKFVLLAALLTLPIFVMLLLLPTMRADTMLMVADIIALISVGLLTNTVKKVNIRDQRLDDKGFQSKNSGVKYNEIKQREMQKAAKQRSNGSSFAIIIVVLIVVLHAGIPVLAIIAEMAGHGGMALGIAVAVIIFFCLGLKQVKASEKGGGSLMVGYIGILVSVLLSALILLINPTDDIFFYLSEVFVLVCIVISQIFAMKEYNLLTTRPLPQLNRKGGDTSAPV